MGCDWLDDGLSRVVEDISGEKDGKSQEEVNDGKRRK